MPQYLAPGVYVEEIPGPRTIAGVSTSTAGFVGPCRFGPTSGRPELLTSYLDFVRIYGDPVDLQLGGSTPVTNHLALGVKAFFDEGGSSLYVARVFAYNDPNTPSGDHGRGQVPITTPKLTFRARFPGQVGNMNVTLTLVVGNNVLVGTAATAVLSRVREFDMVWAVPSSGSAKVQVVRRDPGTGVLSLAGYAPASNLKISDLKAAYPLTVRVDVQLPTVNAQGLATFGTATTVGEFNFDQRSATGISTVLALTPPTRAQGLTLPLVIEGVDSLNLDLDKRAVAMTAELFTSTILGTADNSDTTPDKRQISFALINGTDGKIPLSNNYDGLPTFSDYQSNKTDEIFNGLLALEPIDDISIVAAPGAASAWGQTPIDTYLQSVQNVVVNHCERMIYRTAALDTPPALLPGDALDFRNLRSSTHAAVYYPWVTISHPVDGSPVNVPPAALMTGIWARSDNARGVIKAPANEVVRSALDYEIRINKPQQELLNPQGVNCLRFFPGPGFQVWGARTISEDPEWKYLSIRRYFNYLEKSIDEGTQWVVFEVNGPTLWAAVRHTIEGFLLVEWRSGALLGAKPEQGFFVRCDASTMTSDDLDQGRLVVQIGVAAARPAEFVIFRISQLTASTAS